MTHPGTELKCHNDPDYLPCFSGAFCYHVNETCDGLNQCQTDWADEQNCKSTLLIVSYYLLDIWLLICGVVLEIHIFQRISVSRMILILAD